MRWPAGVPCLLALTVLLLAAGGCDQDEESPLTPESGDNIPDSSLPFPDSPDKLMANFRTIYENRDADEYRLILDPAFETLLQSETQSIYPQVGPTLDVTEEYRIHDRMFTGNSFTDTGDYVPGIQSFSFSHFRRVVDWGESLATDPIPNTESALYEVEILADRGQTASTLLIRGQIRFYVVEAEGRQNGQSKNYYRLRGQIDLTSIMKGADQSSWGTLKASFH